MDVRVIAATHRDLRALKDIAVIADHLLKELGSGRRLEEMPKGTLELLESYDWPGNVRELRNVVARLLLFPEEASSILAPPASGPSDAVDGAGRRLEGLDLPLKAARELVVASFERRYIKAKVVSAERNMTQAVSSAGISMPIPLSAPRRARPARPTRRRLLGGFTLRVTQEVTVTTRGSALPSNVLRFRSYGTRGAPEQSPATSGRRASRSRASTKKDF